MPAKLLNRKLGAGTRQEGLKKPDGVRLKVRRALPATDVAALAGMVQAPSGGMPRRLEDFDPSSLLAGPDEPHR